MIDEARACSHICIDGRTAQEIDLLYPMFATFIIKIATHFRGLLCVCVRVCVCVSDAGLCIFLRRV
jgi:hypothetical protein